MERKVQRPNVRTSSQTTQKKNIKIEKTEDSSDEKMTTLAQMKADEMESGFVKTRKLSVSSTSPSSSAKAEALSKKNNPSDDQHVTNHSEIQDFEKQDFEVKKPRMQNIGMQVTLSPSMCITIFVTFIITSAFIFLFGLIVGKGMIPVASKAEPEKLQAQLHITQNSDKVLAKEELQFMTTLKQESVAMGDNAQGLDNKGNPITTSGLEQNLADAIGEKPEEIIPSTRLFDFNIRVAAFRNSEQADTLREKLEGDGFRTTRVVSKGGDGRNWYFVHVLLRGSEVRLKEAQEQFKKFAIRDSIVQEQKEIK